MTDKKTEALKLTLKRAFNLGQTYWQQADSEYTSQWKKADVTLASFNQLVEDTIREALAEQPAQQQEPVAWIIWGEKNVPALTFTKPAENDVFDDLYTSLPASKPWVGLTENERETIRDSWRINLHDQVFFEIEAKLKEKNT